MSRKFRGLLLGAILGVVSCQSTVISTGFPAPAPSGLTVEGVPYFLPTSLVRISLKNVTDAKGKHKELALETQADLVPDPTAGCLLRADRSWFSEQEHTFRTKDSMLTLVSTEDTSKVEEFFTSLASIAGNVYAFGASGGLHSFASSKDKPTRDEVLEVYQAIPPGPHSLAFPPLQQSAFTLVPGTGGRLKLGARVVAGAFGGAATPASTTPPKGTNYKGIYARVLTPIKVTVSLELDLHLLYQDRIAKLNARAATKAALTSQRQTKQGQVASATGDAKKKLQDEIAALGKRIQALDAEVTKLEQAGGTITQNQTWASSTPAGTFHPIGTQDTAVLVPDEGVLVKVPVTKATFGTSKNTLTLVSGVLSEYKTEHPSSALELVKVPLDISESLLELPTKILQLKLDYTNKQKELTASEKALDDLLREIAENDADPTAHDLLVQQLEQQAAVLELQRKIAELEKQISDLSESDD